MVFSSYDQNLCDALYVYRRMNAKSKQLLSFLFVESQEQALIEDKTEKVTDLGGPDVRFKALEKLKVELSKILTQMGIENVKERLQIDGNAFKLVQYTAGEHALDSAILFDLTKITPLIDANFVALDGEAEKDGSNFILIIHGSENSEATVEEMLEAPPEDDSIHYLQRDTASGATQLIERLLK